MDEFGARSDAKATSLDKRKRVFVAESSLDHHVGGPVEGGGLKRVAWQPFRPRARVSDGMRTRWRASG